MAGPGRRPARAGPPRCPGGRSAGAGAAGSHPAWTALAGLSAALGLLGRIGPVTAAQARQLGAAATDPAAQWRIIVTNPAGQAIAVNRIRRRRPRRTGNGPRPPLPGHRWNGNGPRPPAARRRAGRPDHPDHHPGHHPPVHHRAGPAAGPGPPARAAGPRPPAGAAGPRPLAGAGSSRPSSGSPPRRCGPPPAPYTPRSPGPGPTPTPAAAPTTTAPMPTGRRRGCASRSPRDVTCRTPPAGSPPGAPTSTTPAPGKTAAPPVPATWAVPAAATTSSNNTPAGNSSRPAPATSPGPPRPAGPIPPAPTPTRCSARGSLGNHGRVPKVLIVSNDFPPRRGGIQSFVHALALRTAGRIGSCLRAVVGGRDRLRSPAAVPGDQASNLTDAAGAIGGAPCGSDPEGT